MKIGIRKPSIKKSLKARTTGKLKREAKKAINPLYGKKGMGMLHPKKAVYNKVYKKTTVGVRDLAKGSSKRTQGRASTINHYNDAPDLEKVSFDSLMSKRRWKIGWSVFWVIVGMGCISKNIISALVCVTIAAILLIQAYNAKSKADGLKEEESEDKLTEEGQDLQTIDTGKDEYSVNGIKKDNDVNSDGQEIIIFQKTGVDRLYEVIDYVKKKGIKMKLFTDAYEKGKYWPLEGGSSINVRNNYIHVYCTEKDREIIERCTGLRHTDNSKDIVRPYAFEKLNDVDFAKVVDCLAKNDDNR